MIADLDALSSGPEWGYVTREFAGKTGGVALAAGILGQWLRTDRIRTRLSLLYTGAEPDRYGRGDRRLLWEDFVNREGLPDEATKALLSIPGLGDKSDWILISSPAINQDGNSPWRARTFQGLIDALRIAWADTVCSAMERGENPIGIDAGALILIVTHSDDINSGGPDPQTLTNFSAHYGLPALINIRPADTDPVYRFGRIHNRLLKPPDPFSYLDLLESDEPTPALQDWSTASSAAGYSDVIRREAMRSMEETCTSSKGESLLKSPGMTAPEIRQLSGSASAPGMAVGVLWNPNSGSPRPESSYIIVCDRWNSTLDPYLDGSTGLVERTGGRGGPGAYLARVRGIPAVSEVRYAELLQPGADAEIDGGTGIVTLF